MNKIEHLTVCASEEAGEIAEIAFELGQVALKLSKDFHKALRFGYNDIDPARNKTKIELLAAEFNDLIGCMELLEESGIKFPGLFDRSAIDAKKAKVTHFLGVAKELGTVV